MKRVKNKLLIGLAALTVGVLGAGLAQAQEGVSALKGHDSHAPVDISADRGEAQDRADRVVFAGNVIVKQEELTLRTARLTVAYSNNDSSGNGIDINRIDASGGVVVTSPSETAKGDFGVYDLDKGLITLVGNVRLDRGGSFLNGGRLTIDLNSGRAVMDGGLRGVSQGGGRVSGRFTVPKRNTTPASTTKPATPAKSQ